VTTEGRVLSDAPENLPVVRGKPLDRDAVRESIHVLFRTGDYADVQAVRTAVSDGVRLDFVVRMNLFFNAVKIEGLTAPPTESAAAGGMQIARGQVLRQETVDEAVVRLQDALREEGLYEAKLAVETIPHSETQQLDVIVKVSPGPRARAGEIRLSNHTGYPDGELLSRARFRAGQPITLRRLRGSSERIRKFLTKKGHLGARASVRRGEYDPAEKTIPLELEVS